ncbi:unnamed protein product, partial [Urochloa humidicola]
RHGAPAHPQRPRLPGSREAGGPRGRRHGGARVASGGDLATSGAEAEPGPREASMEAEQWGRAAGGGGGSSGAGPRINGDAMVDASSGIAPSPVEFEALGSVLLLQRTHCHRCRFDISVSGMLLIRVFHGTPTFPFSIFGKQAHH